MYVKTSGSFVRDHSVTACLIMQAQTEQITRICDYNIEHLYRNGRKL